MAFNPVPFLSWTRFYYRVSRPPVAAPDANSPCAGHEIVAAAAIARQRGPVRDLDAAETMTLSPVPIGREIAVKCFLVLLTFRRSPKLRGSPTRDRGSVEAGDARRAWAGREICALDATILIRNLGKSLPNKTQCRLKKLPHRGDRNLQNVLGHRLRIDREIAPRTLATVGATLGRSLLHLMRVEPDPTHIETSGPSMPGPRGVGSQVARHSCRLDG